jgi:hypothetical protein
MLELQQDRIARCLRHGRACAAQQQSKLRDQYGNILIDRGAQ